MIGSGFRGWLARQTVKAARWPRAAALGHLAALTSLGRRRAAQVERPASSCRERWAHQLEITGSRRDGTASARLAIEQTVGRGRRLKHPPAALRNKVSERLRLGYGRIRERTRRSPSQEALRTAPGCSLALNRG